VSHGRGGAAAAKNEACDWSDPVWILSLMHFPADEKRRRTCRAFPSNTQSGVDNDALALFTNAAADDIRPRLQDSSKRGQIAGVALMFLYAMAA
jgi:hypothetical protein